MARRKKQEQSQFNPFVDILTCLAGVMILIIILVVIEAKESKILVPTPIKDSQEIKQPYYIEVDKDGFFFPIPLEELQNLVNVKLKEVSEKAAGDPTELLKLLGQVEVGNENFNIRVPNALTQNLVLEKVKGAQGLELAQVTTFGGSDWFSQLLEGLDKETHMLVFIVRANDVSFQAFKRARAMAHLQNAKVAYEVISLRDPLRFGFGGEWSIPQ